MRTVILASHGHLASGMKNTVEMILGEQEALKAFDAYTTPECNVHDTLEAMLRQADGECVIVTDVLGGSVANAFSGHISHPGVYVLAGVNAPMLLAMVPMLESAMDTQELITQGIQAAREGCVFINGLMKQAFEESEEDFV